MAGYKANWALPVLAIVGCALVCTAAGNEIVRNGLIWRLRDGFITPQVVERILPNFRGMGIKVLVYTVEELIDWCKPTLNKCSSSEFGRILNQGQSYKVEIPRLHEYANYCVTVKLRKYCVGQVNRVGRLLLASMTEEDQELLRGLLQPMVDKGISSKAQEMDIKQEYENLSAGLSDAGDEEKFRCKVANALTSFSVKFGFFYSLNLEQGDIVNKDILLTEWFHLSQISEKFLYTVFPGSWEETKCYVRPSEGRQTSGVATEALISHLMDESTEPEQKEHMLRDYENEEDEVHGRTVREWAEMCQLSLSKCSPEVFERAKEVAVEYKKNAAQLSEYVRYCRDTKLRSYCAENVDDVNWFLHESSDSEDKRLVRHILTTLTRAGVPRICPDTDIAQAYIELRNYEYGQNCVSSDEEETLRRKVEVALNSLGRKQKFVFDLLQGKKLPKRDQNHLLTSNYNFTDISTRFRESVSSVKWIYEIVSNDEAGKPLILQQINEATAPDEVEAMLRDYPSQEVEIYGRSLKELSGLCKVSLGNCSADRFDRVFELAARYSNGQCVPKLFEYGRYCVFEKLTNYCTEKADKVGALLLEGVYEEHKKLARPFLQSLKDKLGRLAEAEDDDVRSAYRKLEKSMHQKNPNDPNDRERFRLRVEEALKSLGKIHDFFSRYLGIQAKDRPRSKSANLLTEFDSLDMIAKVFKSIDWSAGQYRSRTGRFGMTRKSKHEA